GSNSPRIFPMKYTFLPKLLHVRRNVAIGLLFGTAALGVCNPLAAQSSEQSNGNFSIQPPT
ncbi:MAG: hypothetical protein ACOVNV_07710, partial [Pirellulaceae bacterium]